MDREEGFEVPEFNLGPAEFPFAEEANVPQAAVQIIDKYPWRGRRRRVLRLCRTIRQDWLDAVIRHHYRRIGYRTYVNVKRLLYVEGGRERRPPANDLIAVTATASVNRVTVQFHFMVKMPSIIPCCRDFIAETGADWREIRFYSEMVPEFIEFQRSRISNPDLEIKLPVARCYYTKYTPIESRDERTAVDATEESVIVMEDLLYRNFYAVDYAKGLSRQEVEFAAESLSKIHAISLALKVHTNTSIQERYNYLYDPDHRVNCFQELFNSAYPKLVCFLRKRQGSEPIIRRMNKLKPDIKYLMEALLTPEEPMSVLTHGDCWANHMLFNDTECVLLDWRMVSCGRPTNDLALLLATSVRAYTRRRRTPGFLNHYWRHLLANARRFGVDIERDLGYSRERLEQDYRRSLVLAAMIGIMSIDMVIGRRRAENRLWALLKDLNADHLLSINIVRVRYFNF